MQWWGIYRHLALFFCSRTGTNWFGILSDMLLTSYRNNFEKDLDFLPAVNAVHLNVFPPKLDSTIRHHQFIVFLEKPHRIMVILLYDSIQFG